MPVLMSETDHAFIALFKLLIGSSVVGDAERAAGMDSALSRVVEMMKGEGRLHAAAVIEGIRLASTGPAGNAAKAPAMVEGLNKSKN
ncbi:MAG: hypothetical protein INR65_18540 [Gluconacetobacter diazotrophicus]|nr:hypothetical protein [Gluconacetobacter diazotrophicus]